MWSLSDSLLSVPTNLLSCSLQAFSSILLFSSTTTICSISQIFLILKLYQPLNYHLPVKLKQDSNQAVVQFLLNVVETGSSSLVTEHCVHDVTPRDMTSNHVTSRQTT